MREKKPVWRQLCGFSDGCIWTSHYSGCLYLRTVYEAGDVDEPPIASKTKVAPLKKRSIPRLELMGAYILSKLVDSL